MNRRALAVLILAPILAVFAEAETNLGGGVAIEAGGSPLVPVLPQLFVQEVYRAGPWETFGLDLVLGIDPLESSSYVSGAAAGPEVFVGVDATYRFPRVGPVELAVLVGGWRFSDYHNRVNGVSAQTGVEATLPLGSFFVQGRALYRFYSSTGLSDSPVPLGTVSLALLGGYSLK